MLAETPAPSASPWPIRTPSGQILVFAKHFLSILPPAPRWAPRLCPDTAPRRLTSPQVAGTSPAWSRHWTQAPAARSAPSHLPRDPAPVPTLEGSPPLALCSKHCRDRQGGLCLIRQGTQRESIRMGAGVRV